MKFPSLLLTLLILPMMVHSQSAMDKGFRMLETGKFADAAIFFHDYLKKDSLNQTALICYARGVGLSGKTDLAKEVLKKLQTRFPNNYEIDINMAEAQMWSKNFVKALALYDDLVRRDTTSFAALLGYANAFSESKKYIEALNYVEKALKVSPNNANAMMSRKFMRLGRGGILANDGKFDEAIALYNLILAENSKDIDALVNKAQVLMAAERYIEAKSIHEILVGLPSKKTDGYLGLSLVTNKLKNNDSALFWAKKAIETADSTNALKAYLGLVNAYAWKKDFKSAFVQLDKLRTAYPNDVDVISAYGRINIWSKEFTKALKHYQKLLVLVPSSFDGNLGYADASHAQGLDNESFKYVRKTLEYFPNQRDALQFLEKLHIAHDPTIFTHVFFSKDNGGNVSQNYRAKISLDPHALVKAWVTYYQRSAQNLKESNSTLSSIQQMSTGASYRISGAIKLFAEATLVTTLKYNRIIGDAGMELNIGKYQILELKYYNELQSFTASLIDRNIRMDNIQANYNLSLPFKVGLYSQMINTRISDDNQRNLLFVSVYYDLLQSPVLKAGINVSIFSFKKQVPKVYFSPNIFKGYELFAASENVNEPKAKKLYQITVAGGVQKISNEKFQNIYRFDIKAGWRFNKRLWAMLYIMRSNSAASSVQGFTYNETGIRAQYIIPAMLL